jgi:hypothetical protein
LFELLQLLVFWQGVVRVDGLEWSTKSEILRKSQSVGQAFANKLAARLNWAEQNGEAITPLERQNARSITFSHHLKKRISMRLMMDW